MPDRRESNGKVTFTYFSESKVRLSEEIANHPDLCALVSKHPASEFELRLAEVAAYCEVALDGAYTPEDIDEICNRLYEKLRKVRMIHVS